MEIMQSHHSAVERLTEREVWSSGLAKISLNVSDSTYSYIQISFVMENWTVRMALMNFHAVSPLIIIPIKPHKAT